MVTLKKCCYCVELELGCVIIGYLWLVINTTIFACDFYVAANLAQYFDSVAEILWAPIFIFTIFHFFISLINIIAGLVLLYGLHKKMKTLLQVYFVYCITLLLVNIIIYAAVMIMFADAYDTNHWIQNGVEIAVIVVIYVYFGVVIKSYHQKLKEEDKTALMFYYRNQDASYN